MEQLTSINFKALVLSFADWLTKSEKSSSTIKNYPTRVNCFFEGKTGQLAIDQIRSVDKTRLIKKTGILEEDICILLCRIMVETFKF